MRLALEMAVNEESEHRALEGELALLELAWKDAEEIATIADTLLVPADVEASLLALRRR
jgi:Flp pilus assembly protein TadD